MAKFHSSHFIENDKNYPINRGRRFYDVTFRFITPIECWCVLFKFLLTRSPHHKNLNLMNNRLVLKWRSLTSGRKKQIL